MTTSARDTKAADARPTRVRNVVRGALGGRLGAIVAASLFINLLTLGAPIFSIQVFDRVVPYAGVETLKALVLVMAAVLVFDFIFKQARARLSQSLALDVDVALSRALFARLCAARLERLEARSDADWRATLRDAEAVRDAVAGPTLLLAVDAPFIIMFIAIIGVFAPPLAVVLIMLTPVYLAIAALSSWAVRRAAREEHDQAADAHALLGEVVSGRATAKALGLGPALGARLETAQAGVIRRALRRGAHVDFYNHVFAVLGVGTTVLMTTVGAISILGQEMTIGGLIAANMLAARVVQPLTQLINLWRGLERYAQAAERLDAVLAEPLELERGALSRPRPAGVLKLERVVFSYAEGAPPVVDGVTASFEPGVMTGIFGANGSGKTTLLKLAMRLYTPRDGRVLLDGADMAQFGRAEIASWIGYVPQEPFLFEGSVRDNIARARADVSDEEVLAAARSAGVDAIIADLPEGYATAVGEGGRRFSPGVRQRIALARALLGDPPALLLDEPSANLDFDAETKLCETLRALKETRTIVLVSHARALLERCDMLIAMRGGKVVMSGRAEDLMPAASPRAMNAGAPSAAASLGAAMGFGRRTGAGG